MLIPIYVLKPLSKPEVDKVDRVNMPSNPKYHVIWLDVTVYVSL
jgi:hypothetical protein